jgi:hypothetical protein
MTPIELIKEVWTFIDNNSQDMNEEQYKEFLRDFSDQICNVSFKAHQMKDDEFITDENGEEPDMETPDIEEENPDDISKVLSPDKADDEAIQFFNAWQEVRAEKKMGGMDIKAPENIIIRQ